MAQNKLLDPIVSSAAVLTGVGNGTLTVDRLTHFTITQDYTATCIQISPSTVFSIVGSLDGPVGLATVGTQFIDADLKIFLTIQQGVTPFQVGDQFALSVQQGTDLSQDNIDDYDELPQKNFGEGDRGDLSGDHNLRYSNAARKAYAYHQDLFFEAVTAGASSVQIQYTPGTAGSEVASAVGNLISVTMEDGKSTAQQILTAILAAPTVTALINASLIGNGANPQFDSGTVISLSGGKNKQFAFNHDELTDSGAFVEGNADILAQEVKAQGGLQVAGHSKLTGTVSLENSSADNKSGIKVPDAQQYINRLIQDRKTVLRTLDNSKVKWAQPDFTFDEDLVIYFADTGFENIVDVSESPITIADGESLYVILDRYQDKTLTPFVASLVPGIINAYRIATRFGDDLILADNTFIADGKSVIIGQGGGGTGIAPITALDDSSTTLPSSSGNPDVTFYASFNTDEDAEYAGGSPTGALFNGATVTGGEAVLNTAGARLQYSGAANADFTTTGTIRFKVKPGYSGTPSDFQVFYAASHNGNFLGPPTPLNYVNIQHTTGGNLYLGLTDQGGVAQHDAPIGAWSPTSGQTYEFELNIDTSSIARLFIDGVLFYSTALSYVRDNNTTVVDVGNFSFTPTGLTPNFAIDELVIFDTVQHTAGYSAPSAAPSLSYAPDGVTIATDDLVLFTNLTNPADNDRIYLATVSGGSITWELQSLGQDPTGAPADGDAVYVKEGTTWGDKLFFFNGTEWFNYDSYSANRYLSNLLSPTAINQDLTFAHADRALQIAQAPSETGGGDLTLSAGDAQGTNQVGGKFVIETGLSTGNGEEANPFTVRASFTGSSGSSPQSYVDAVDVNTNTTFLRSTYQAGNGVKFSYLNGELFIGKVDDSAYLTFTSTNNVVVFGGGTFTVPQTIYQGSSPTNQTETRNFSTFTINNNVSSPALIDQWDQAQSRSIFIEFEIERDGETEFGEIRICNNDTVTSIMVNSTATAPTGVTFSADLSGGDMRLLYTSTNTVAGTLRYRTIRMLR